MMRGMVAVLTTSLLPPMWMLTPPDRWLLVLTLRLNQQRALISSVEAGVCQHSSVSGDGSVMAARRVITTTRRLRRRACL